MDILTPKGQETLKQERRALDLFSASYGAFSFVETPKDKPADLDGFIYKDGVLIAGVEVKCRMMTAVDLREKFNREWLITDDKIDRGVSVCEKLCIDYKGFLYLVPDDLLLIVPIWSYSSGTYTSEIRRESTKTQKTVNGGEIVRLNAYVDVSRAKAVVQKS